MDANRVEGAAKDFAGKVQDAAGGLFGDSTEQVKGKARQAAGQAQGYYGSSLDSVRDLAADQPLVALGAALAAGFIAGAIFARR